MNDTKNGEEPRQSAGYRHSVDDETASREIGYSDYAAPGSPSIPILSSPCALPCTYIGAQINAEDEFLGPAPSIPGRTREREFFLFLAAAAGGGRGFLFLVLSAAAGDWPNKKCALTEISADPHLIGY